MLIVEIRKIFLNALFVLICLHSFNLQAKTVSDNRNLYNAKSINENLMSVSDSIEEVSPPRFQIQLQGGIDISSSKEFKTVYGSISPVFMLQLSFLIIPSFHIDTAIGYLRQKGNTVGKESLEASGVSAVWVQNPFSLGLSYHIGKSSFAPYVGVGARYDFYLEKTEGEKASGGKLSIQAKAGIRYKLPIYNAPSWSIDAKKGIRESHIVLEYGYHGGSKLWQDGIDLSSMWLTFGLDFAF